MSRNGNAVVWMVSGAFLFALMAAMTRFLADDVSWAAIASVRSLIAFVFAALGVLIAGSKLVVWRPRTLWVRSLAGSTSLLCAFFAMTHLPLADSVTLFYLQAIWIPCLSWLFLRYAITPRDLLAVASGIIGVVLIVQPHFTSTGVATVVAVLGSVAAAAAMIGLHRVRGVDTWAIVAHFSGVSSVVAVCGWLVVPEPLPFAEWHLKSFVVLGGIGVCGVLAQFCMTKSYAKGNPTWVGVAGLSQVVFAAGLDMLIWRRSFSLYAILGMVLITAPSAWLMTRRVDMQIENAPETEGKPLPVDGLA
jgi:drug/metabolite transporter (DMT)-like permease